jgi:uncharacterized DUF497 family protein
MAMADDSPQIERLAWDDWNRGHIAKHGVAPSAVEEAVFGETVAQPTYKRRFLVLGPTHAGRMLAVVIGPVPGHSGAYYTFSARPASRSERRFYQRVKAGEEQ